MNWAGFFQAVNELYQTAIHPALSPSFGQFIWRVKTARNSRGSGFTTWQTRQKQSPERKVGRLWSDVREEVWFGSFFQRLIVF
jgi:hypothetical protein